MVLKTGTFEDLANEVRGQHKKIVLFGTGVIGSTVVPYLIEKYALQEFVIYCIDNDKTRWGECASISTRQIPIVSPCVLDELDSNVVILINISRYAEVITQLDGMESCKNKVGYIIPMMCIENFKKNNSGGAVSNSYEKLIPKKIHYIWFGNNPLPKQLEKCITSWKKFCPDYEIIRWDENNYDIKKCRYMEDAYNNKKYSFASDYAKLDILYNNGGIYFDTDVEIIRSIDDLLYQEAFCSVEKWQVINFGGCSGAVKGHPAVKKFIEAWENRSYFRADGSPDFVSSGIIDTKVAIDNGYIINGENQNIMGMNVYTYDYFHPYDYMSGKLNLTENTYSIHHFNGGWLDEKAKAVNRKTSESYDKIYKRACGAQA